MTTIINYFPRGWRASSLRGSLGLLLALGGLSACHFVADFDETQIERTEEKTYLFPQKSDVKGWDILMVVDTRAATALEVAGGKVADWVSNLAWSQGCDWGIRTEEEGGNTVPEPMMAPQANPIHIGFVSSDIGMGSNVAATWDEINTDPGKPQLLPPPGCSWTGRQARLLHPPLARPGQGGPMHPFIVLQNCQVANFLGEDGQEIVFDATDTEGPELFLREAVAAFWDAVVSERSTCPYQQPLKAAVRALDYNLYNLGFLRTEAALGVLTLTPGDDCSLNRPSEYLIDANQYPATLRQVSPFDCFALGVTCDEPLSEPGSKSGCRDLEVLPSEEPPLRFGSEGDIAYEFGVMAPASYYASRLRDLKPDRPALLLAIAGPEGPVEVTGQSPQLQVSPVYCDLLPTLPGIRLKAYAQTPTEDWYRPLCGGDLADLGLQATNAYQNQAVSRCFPDVLVDQDPVALGLQANCTVEFVNAPGSAQETILAQLEPCSDFTGMYPFCWNLWENPPDPSCSTGLILAIENYSVEWGMEFETGEVVRALCTMERK